VPAIGKDVLKKISREVPRPAPDVLGRGAACRCRRWPRSASAADYLPVVLGDPAHAAAAQHVTDRAEAPGGALRRELPAILALAAVCACLITVIALTAVFSSRPARRKGGTRSPPAPAARLRARPTPRSAAPREQGNPPTRDPPGLPRRTSEVTVPPHTSTREQVRFKRRAAVSVPHCSGDGRRWR
jgi:hypothetical protein